jgi:hypothetical protein
MTDQIYVNTGVKAGTIGAFIQNGIDRIFPAFAHSIGQVSKKIKESPGLFVRLPRRPPLVEDGILLLSGRVAIYVSADDIVRGRVCKGKTLSIRAFKEFVYGIGATSSSGGNAGDSLAEGSESEIEFDSAFFHA